MPVLGKDRVIGLVSLACGFASVILGYWMAGYFCLALHYFLTSAPIVRGGQSWRVFIFQITKLQPVAFMVGWIGVAAATGAFGYWLVRRRRLDGRASLAASAARLAIAGLVGVGLDMLILAGMLGYRLYRLFG